MRWGIAWSFFAIVNESLDTQVSNLQHLELLYSTIRKAKAKKISTVSYPTWNISTTNTFGTLLVEELKLLEKFVDINNYETGSLHDSAESLLVELIRNRLLTSLEELRKSDSAAAWTFDVNVLESEESEDIEGGNSITFKINIHFDNICVNVQHATESTDAEKETSISSPLFSTSVYFTLESALFSTCGDDYRYNNCCNEDDEKLSLEGIQSLVPQIPELSSIQVYLQTCGDITCKFSIPCNNTDENKTSNRFFYLGYNTTKSM